MTGGLANSAGCAQGEVWSFPRCALYRLLASMIDPYIDSFDEEPLPVDVADENFARVLDIVRYAEGSVYT